MTLFCSLNASNRQHQFRQMPPAQSIPFFESCDTLLQISPCVEFWVLDLDYLYFRERMAKEGAQMRREASKGVIAALL
jgi:hypothetical protein